MDQDMICQAPGCGHSLRDHSAKQTHVYAGVDHGICLVAGCPCSKFKPLLAKEEVAKATTATMLSLALAEGLIATGPSRIVRYEFLGGISKAMR